MLQSATIAFQKTNVNWENSPTYKIYLLIKYLLRAMEQTHSFVNNVCVIKLTRGTGNKLTGIKRVLKS